MMSSEAHKKQIGLAVASGFLGSTVQLIMKRQFSFLFGCLLLAAPVALQAQFTYTNNNGAITITGYAGTNSAVVIPDTIAGQPVTSIGKIAFSYNSNMTSVTIPNTITNIGLGAFWLCSRLTAVTILNGVISIGQSAFFSCESLTAVTIPNSVTSIEPNVFWHCLSLTNITIPSSVTNIGMGAFGICYNLTGVYFEGNAPSLDAGVNLFDYDDHVVCYYLPGTTGWGTSFNYRPTAVWTPSIQTSDTIFGVSTNIFGFNINWASGMSVVVEASSSLSNPVWSPLVTNAVSRGTFYFSDPQWTNYPSRFYRVRSQ